MIVRVDWERIARSYHMVQTVTVDRDEELPGALWLFARDHLRSTEYEVVIDGARVELRKPKPGADPVVFGTGTLSVVG